MRDKRGVETHPREGVIKEKFPHSRKPSHRWVCGEFWNLREQHNWEGVGENPQNTHLTSTVSREVAQRLASTTSKQGLDGEAWAA